MPDTAPEKRVARLTLHTFSEAMRAFSDDSSAYVEPPPHRNISVESLLPKLQKKTLFSHIENAIRAFIIIEQNPHTTTPRDFSAWEAKAKTAFTQAFHDPNSRLEEKKAVFSQLIKNDLLRYTLRSLIHTLNKEQAALLSYLFADYYHQEGRHGDACEYIQYALLFGSQDAQTWLQEHDNVYCREDEKIIHHPKSQQCIALYRLLQSHAKEDGHIPSQLEIIYRSQQPPYALKPLSTNGIATINHILRHLPDDASEVKEIRSYFIGTLKNKGRLQEFKQHFQHLPEAQYIIGLHYAEKGKLKRAKQWMHKAKNYRDDQLWLAREGTFSTISSLMPEIRSVLTRDNYQAKYSDAAE